MSKLVLVRHGESVWNKENLFTGWTDVDLSEAGIEEAHVAGRDLLKEGYHFDVCFTSYLKRAIHTLNNILDELDQVYLPVTKAWQLNERHYGALQGLNKSETAAKYGEPQVKIWRRSYDVCPPELKEDDPRNPALQPVYAGVDKKDLPLTESLKITVDRVVPYYEEHIKPLLKEGKDVLVVAHGNSLRALIMYLDHMTKDEILAYNLPTATPVSYEFDKDMNHGEKKYICSPETLQAKMDKVANQGKAK